MAYQNTFKRYEIKNLIDKASRDVLFKDRSVKGKSVTLIYQSRLLYTG